MTEGRDSSLSLLLPYPRASAPDPGSYLRYMCSVYIYMFRMFYIYTYAPVSSRGYPRPWELFQVSIFRAYFHVSYVYVCSVYVCMFRIYVCVGVYLYVRVFSHEHAPDRGSYLKYLCSVYIYTCSVNFIDFYMSRTYTYMIHKGSTHIYIYSAVCLYILQRGSICRYGSGGGARFVMYTIHMHTQTYDICVNVHTSICVCVFIYIYIYIYT